MESSRIEWSWGSGEARESEASGPGVACGHAECAGKDAAESVGEDGYFRAAVSEVAAIVAGSVDSVTFVLWLCDWSGSVVASCDSVCEWVAACSPWRLSMYSDGMTDWVGVDPADSVEYY